MVPQFTPVPPLMNSGCFTVYLRVVSILSFLGIKHCFCTPLENGKNDLTVTRGAKMPQNVENILMYQIPTEDQFTEDKLSFTPWSTFRSSPLWGILKLNISSLGLKQV